MRFSLPDAYTQFFLEHQVLEIENLLSSKDAKILCENSEELLIKKTNAPLNQSSNLDIWKRGQNLWKDSPFIKSLLFKLQLGEIAGTLFKKRPIRLACTQTLFSTGQSPSPFEQSETLENISSITPILGGVILCLRSLENAEKMPLPSLLNLQEGSALFFSATHPIPFKELFLQSGMRLFMVCFAPTKIRYKLEKKDPLTHELKKAGYAFGDQPDEDICPYIWR